MKSAGKVLPGSRARGSALITVILVVLVLTVVGLTLRGPDWRLVLPF